ncbi:MAG TPA: tetratricopeptide repeat protein [Alphaproteobacteria bacterium]|nr:tetratricopeptide repeat protein [Alphaproteobacteria bacterium]
MSDFFKELEDDIREERVYILWRKYGNYVIGLALAIVIATAGYTLWNYLKHQSQLKAHVSFSGAVELLKQGKKEDALKAFQTLAQAGGGYGKLAQLYEAALLPNPEDLYMKISQKNASDPALGNLPKILMASRFPSNAEALASLQSLTSPNNAWAPLALELLAFNNLKNGDEAKAAESFIKILKEPYTTSNEQLRASLMLSQIDIPPSLLEKEEKGEVKP